MPAQSSHWIDITEAGGLQAALDSLPEHGGAVYVPAGVHEFDRPVVKKLAERQHLSLVGDGRASVLVNTNTAGEPLLHVTGVEGSWWPDLKISVSGLTLVGNHSSGDGLILDFPNDALVDACFFMSHGGQAIRLGPQGTNVTVRDCWLRDCRRGVRAENIHHLTLHGNQTRSVKDGVEQYEQVYLSWHCREVRVVNNHIAYGHHEAIVLDGAAHHVIANNTIEGFPVSIDCRGEGMGKARAQGRDVTINANYIHGDVGVRLAGPCNGFAITGNDFISNACAAIELVDAAGAGRHTITGNTIRKSVFDGVEVPGFPPEQGGIQLGAARDCVVSANLLDGIRPGPGIAADAAGAGHVITSNRIVCDPDHALDIRAADCIVEHNRVG